MRDAVRLPTAMVAAAAVGYLAYLSPTTLYLLAAFPVLLTWARTRWGAGCTAWAFFLGPCSAIAGVLQNWIAGTGQPIGTMGVYGYPLLLSILLALPFVLVNPAASPLRRSIQMAVALVVLTVPPLGFVAWINPLMLSAALFPGAGIALGLSLGLLVMALLAARPWSQDSHPIPKLGLAVVLVGVVAAHSIDATYPNPQPPLGWYGIDTHHGPGLPTPEAREFRVALIESQVRPFLAFPETSLLVFPESLLPDYSAEDAPRLSALRRRLQDSGAHVLIGITPKAGAESWRNQLLLVGSGEDKVLSETRIPVPVGNWRLGGAGVPLNGLASGLVEVEGTMASVTICYEEFPLWAHLRADSAEVLVSAANLWMLTDTVLSYQRTAIRSVARLTGKPLVRAENLLPSRRNPVAL